MSNFDIAGLRINWKAQIQLQEFFSLFSLFTDDEKPFNITFSSMCIPLINNTGKQIYSERNFSWWQTESHIEINITKNDNFKPYVILEANKDWSEILFKANTEFDMKESIRTLSEIAFRTSILFYNGIVIHSAAVKWQEKGILFSAPSGTGKSTQAHLWKDSLGVSILNEDRPAVRTVNNDVYVYGTPWSGSSNECINDSAPLSAIIILEQYKENIIERLPEGEALIKLAPRCFLPYFNEKLMDKALDNISSIIKKVPVYLLKCRPDLDAVETVMKCL